ncbi:MAG: SCP2 sterol-binding domain-containing protein [Cellulosilyticaceae bacterium]
MKIVLLLADIAGMLKHFKADVIKVLNELDIEVDVVDLNMLPYYKTDENSPFAMLLAERIGNAKGIVALVNVHITGMHSSMQSFLEHMSEYRHEVDCKMLLPITYSISGGEQQAAYSIQQAWNTIGGADSALVYLNPHTEIDIAKEHIERTLENFYRTMKQERRPIRSSEYYRYSVDSVDSVENFSSRQLKVDAIPKSFNKEELKDITKIPKNENDENIYEKKKDEEVKKSFIDLSTKEQNIYEITQLLQNSKEYKGEKTFTELPTSTYTRPSARQGENVKKGAKLSAITHYFVAQHDTSTDISIQYTLLDTQQRGVISIKDGDCEYRDGVIEQPTVELMMNDEVLTQILKKQITYQKAFMIGKLKVKGNFGILSKLDQSFKAM